MKNLLLIIVLLFSVGVNAQAPAPTDTPKQPSADEIKQARETLRAILDETPETKANQGKSVADVMDKGLDIVTGYVSTLEGVVSKFAPEVWRIMVKQQYAKAIASPLFWGLLLLVPLLVHYYGRRSLGATKGQTLWEVDTRSDGFLYFLYGVAPMCVGIFFGVMFAWSLTEGIMIAINPEYYALKDIINMLR
jgi:hypothetical protein